MSDKRKGNHQRKLVPPSQSRIENFFGSSGKGAMKLQTGLLEKEIATGSESKKSGPKRPLPYPPAHNPSKKFKFFNDVDNRGPKSDQIVSYHPKQSGEMEAALSHLPKLPNKCLLKIFGYLSLRDLNTATQVCRLWQLAGNNNGFWKPQIKQRFPKFEWICRSKLRPMGVCKHLFNSTPLLWNRPLPVHGAYIWYISFTPLSRSQDKIQELMGVGEAYIQLGVEYREKNQSTATQRKPFSLQSNSAIKRSNSFTSAKHCIHQLSAKEDGELLLLVDRVLNKFTVFSPSSGEYTPLPWKGIPHRVGNLFPCIKTNSASLQILIVDLLGNKESFSLSISSK